MLSRIGRDFSYILRMDIGFGEPGIWRRPLRFSMGVALLINSVGDQLMQGRTLPRHQGFSWPCPYHSTVQTVQYGVAFRDE